MEEENKKESGKPKFIWKTAIKMGVVCSLSSLYTKPCRAKF